MSIVIFVYSKTLTSNGLKSFHRVKEDLYYIFYWFKVIYGAHLFNYLSKFYYLKKTYQNVFKLEKAIFIMSGNSRDLDHVTHHNYHIKS